MRSSPTMPAPTRPGHALDSAQASSSSPLVIPSPAASHEQTDHRFSLYQHPSAYHKTQSYRAAPPSFASTSSYTPSVASLATAIAPYSIPDRTHASSWGGAGASREVDTCLAPSAHIWEDFYNEFKGVHMDEDGVESHSTPTSSEPQATPQSSDELFSSFSFFGAPEVEAPVDSTHPVSATDSSFPGAEFLDIPPSAASHDQSMLPDLTDIDFSKLDWLPDFLSPDRLPGHEPALKASDASHHPTSPFTSSLITPSSSAMGRPGRVAESHKTSNSHHDAVAPQAGTSPNTDAHQTMTLSAKLNAGAPTGSQHGGGQVGACVEGNAVEREVANAPLDDQRPKTGIPIVPDIAPAHQSPCLASNSTGEQDRSVAMEDFAALSQIKVWATPKDREVLRFQKNVLSIAAEFYMGLAALFDETDRDVIKLGMTRAGMGHDESLQDIVNDMKELCGRLMVRKNAILDTTESPKSDSGNTPFASDSALLQASTAMRPPPVPQTMSPGKKRKTPDSPSTPRSPLPPTIPATPASPAKLLFTNPNAVLASLPDPSSLPQPGKVIHGPWKTAEVNRLQGLVEISRGAEDGAPKEHVDWTWVVANFGPSRNRHQVLIKAVELGLRETSTHYSRRVKQKSFREVQSPEPKATHKRELPPAWPHQSPTLAPMIMPAPYPLAGSPLSDPVTRPSSSYLGSPQMPKNVHRRHNSSSSSTATATRTPARLSKGNVGIENGNGFGGLRIASYESAADSSTVPWRCWKLEIMPGIAPSVVSPTAGEFGYRIQAQSEERSPL
ncbi:hypothetical protein IAR50_004623 [Cryptococcus sp. DSM 104548]